MQSTIDSRATYDGGADGSGIPAIELRDVTVVLGGHRALEEVQLSVPVHDFLAVIGPNGGGKTTLLRVIMGLVRPTSGSVRVLGRDPDAVRGRVAYVPQYALFDLDFPIRVCDVVGMGRLRAGRLLRPQRHTDREIVLRALERVGLPELALRRIAGLSGGQMQRVLIARALAVQAEILILDEPTASLDVQSAESFYLLLADLANQMTVVLTSHDIGSVSTHVRNMACLNSRLYSHALGDLTPARVAEIYGCPIELVAHGVPHRVLTPHEQQQADAGGLAGHGHAHHEPGGEA